MTARFELRLELRLVFAEAVVGEPQLVDQAVVVALEPKRMDELIDDLQQILQLPRLGDDVVEVARVDRRDQVIGLGGSR
ncbi:MAG: hypothetical protein IPQ07_10795 [Myxococcales bacterium]|nr:hypothetical protein [Myxococcales bacterium]